MMTLTGQRLELELELLSELDAAKARWDESRQMYAAAKVLVQDIELGAHRDGSMALRQYLVAQRSMVRASEEYRFKLGQFADVIVHRRSPRTE